jgi:hypothetical protein
MAGPGLFFVFVFRFLKRGLAQYARFGVDDSGFVIIHRIFHAF